MNKNSIIAKFMRRSVVWAGAILPLLAGMAIHPASAAFPPEDSRAFEAYEAPAFLGGLYLSDRGPALPLQQATQITEVAAYDHLFTSIERWVPADNAIDGIETGSIVAGAFNSVAIPIHNFPVAKRWERIMRMISDCAAASACAGNSELLVVISEKAEGKSLVEKVKLVNSTINNTLIYRADQSIYKIVDYWATPAEILASGSGDCEDFVILKMTALMRAGVPARSLSLVAVRDNDRGVFHAVLAVSTSSGTFILDNARAKVAMDTDIPNYQPLYSLSDDRAWIHGTRSPSRQELADTRDFASIAPGEGISSGR